MIKLGDLMMILDLHRQGLSVSAIARQCNVDRKTVRRYIARGLEPPAYGPRQPRATLLDPFTGYLRERVSTFPGLSGARLWRELRDRGYQGCYSAETDYLRDVRPAPERPFEVRFETGPGEQGQVDFAQFQVTFTDEPTTQRIVWLFSMVLGYSRMIWARFVVHQDLVSTGTEVSPDVGFQNSLPGRFWFRGSAGVVIGLDPPRRAAAAFRRRRRRDEGFRANMLGNEIGMLAQAIA